MSSAIITLTTDFGHRDHYVAAVKGVILSLNPEAVLVDISHDVPPQDVASASFLLAGGAATFPAGTVHLAVVDPGVGTARRALAVRLGGHTFVAPDNGLLSYVLLEAGIPSPAEPTEPAPEGAWGLVPTALTGDARAFELTDRRFWCQPVSATFHGRDIFAPVAAHLSLGVPVSEMGTPLDAVLAFALPAATSSEGVVTGQVVYVDGFGNLVTNIRQAELPSAGLDAEVEVEGRRLRGLAATYAEGEGLRCLVGSSGHLEIAARNASAAVVLGVGLGAQVRVRAAPG